MMATPLHSQNFLDVDTGILTNNRRLVTRAMWANGTVISGQARRALEHERVTIVSHETGWIHLLYPEATIGPAAYADFTRKLNAFLDPPEGSPDMTRVTPRLPDPARVRFVKEDQPLALTPDMPREEIARRVASCAATNRAAALAPYAARDLAATEPGPFVQAALDRNPVSRAALAGLGPAAALAKIAALPGESIYDGPARLAQPDEVWNFGRGDGLEKCLLAANALGGDELSVADGRAVLRHDGAPLCSFPTTKRPRETTFTLRSAKRR